MTTCVSENLKPYAIRECLRHGASSVSYAALHTDIGMGLKVERKVTLKFSWNVSAAEEEARGMVKLSGKRGFLSLYDCFRVPYHEVMALLAPAMQRSDDSAPSIQAEQDIVVLVTQFALGQDLVKTEAIASKAPIKVTEGSWLIEVDGKPYRQSLPESFGPDERLHLLRNLIKLVKHAHEQEPRQVLGQLQPGGLLYDSEGGGDIRLVDWKGVESFEAAAWQSPWHSASAEALPSAADIYQLALWVDRILGPGDRAWRKFARAITLHQDPTKLPTIQAFEERLNQIATKVAGRMHRQTLTLLWLGILVALGLGGWKLWRDHVLSPQRQTIARLRSEAGKSDEQAQEVIGELRTYLGEKEFQPIREEVAGCIGDLRYQIRVEYKFLERLEWNKPNAIYLSNKKKFVIYECFPFEVGEPINEQEYLSEIQAKKMVVRNRKTNRYRTIHFPRHPLVGDQRIDGQFIIYDSDLWDIRSALSQIVGINPDYMTSIRPRIFGLMIEESPDLVYSVISASLDRSHYQRFPVLVENCLRFCYWDLEKGTRLNGTLEDLAVSVLNEDLKINISGQELLKEKVDMVLKTRTNGFEWFREQALLSGCRMELSEDGQNIRFTKPGVSL